uniref:Uncharacterized protein n=1 Tax=Molossus molossus TaxID=27622 RepID=A0A7J8E2B7_MOLMO|nr:hypothetical protein HJG59_008973 [Molossus molossus]
MPCSPAVQIPQEQVGAWNSYVPGQAANCRTLQESIVKASASFHPRGSPFFPEGTKAHLNKEIGASRTVPFLFSPHGKPSPAHSPGVCRSKSPRTLGGPLWGAEPSGVRSRPLSHYPPAGAVSPEGPKCPPIHLPRLRPCRVRPISGGHLLPHHQGSRCGPAPSTTARSKCSTKTWLSSPKSTTVASR